MISSFFRRLIKQIGAFFCDQYLVLFFSLALGFKLYYFSTYIIKFTWSNQYVDGVVCGCFSAAIIFLPIYFFRKHKNLLAIILATFISILLIADNIYYAYFSSLPTVGLLSAAGLTKDVGPAISGMLHWKYLLYFCDVVLALFFVKPMSILIKKIKTKYEINEASTKASWLMVLITIIAFYLSILPPGINTLVDVFEKGYDTVSATRYYGLPMAQAIDTARIIKQETTSLSGAETQTLADWVIVNKPVQITDSLTGVAKGKNVILIQVESLGGFVINQAIDNKKITPNLNMLSKVSHYFPNNRFIFGAGHTSDTDFVANTSYFPLDDASAFVRYGLDDFTSLPKTLVANGYSAYAYHGFNRNFWNRDIALRSLGYQKFYAVDNYPNGAKINMGLNDGDFLSKTAEFIIEQPKPSLSSVITLSSHVPFEITDQTKNLGLNINDYPDQVGGYLENINYTDRMLDEFFAKLKTAGLYDDSLILVYGDHVPVLPAFNAGTISYNPETIQGKEVPLLIKLPNQTTGAVYGNQGTNLDIMPTIIDLLGVKTDQLVFGQSLFIDNKPSDMACPDQLYIMPNLGDCSSSLITEKNISATIIRYNQFDNLQRNGAN